MVIYIKRVAFNYFMTKVPIICRANQWTGFYMIGTSVMKELRGCVIKVLDLIPLPVEKKSRGTESE